MELVDEQSDRVGGDVRGRLGYSEDHAEAGAPYGLVLHRARFVPAGLRPVRLPRVGRDGQDACYLDADAVRTDPLKRVVIAEPRAELVRRGWRDQLVGVKK